MADRRTTNQPGLYQAIIEGAVMRVRPMAMTAAVVIAGLLPIMLSGRTGSEVMKRIAAPMLEGMIATPLVSMVFIPASYFLWHGRKLIPAAEAEVKKAREKLQQTDNPCSLTFISHHRLARTLFLANISPRAEILLHAQAYRRIIRNA